MGKACEVAHLHMDEESGRVRDMRDRLERELTALIPNTRINGGGGRDTLAQAGGSEVRKIGEALDAARAALQGILGG